VDPFRGLVTDDEVVGRGATDMKSGLIAHAFAMKALRECGIRLEGDVVLQSVVCEPTNHGDGPPMVSPTAPGTLWFAVIVEGLTAHAGFRGLTVHPALRGQRLGVNVPDKLWLIYQAMRQLEDEWAYRDRHPLFAPETFHLLPG
jgi:acetylornithine deacetylase